MERFAKSFRAFAGLFVLVNLAAFFLPYGMRVQKNYGTLQWSPLAYFQYLVEGVLPHGTEAAVRISMEQSIVLVALLGLPVVLAFVAGVGGIVGSPRQILSSITCFVVFLMEVGVAVFGISFLAPPVRYGQQYVLGWGMYVALGVSGAAALFSVLALLATPRIRRQAEGEKAAREEGMRQAAMAAAQGTGVPQPQGPQAQGQPQRLLMGISGMYKDAVIPLDDGIPVWLGRRKDNHLVFDGDKAISRYHCQIRWDPARQEYGIIDKSTNGCFLNGGAERLPQNREVWLPPGGQIRLGNSENVFVLG